MAVVEALGDIGVELGSLRLPREFCPIDPTAKQEYFLRLDDLEVFFGGAAGPGKSFGLLMGGLQYVDVAGYNAVILRTVLQDHKKPKALIPVSHDLLGPTSASWNGSENMWTFPSGATLSFSYVRTAADLSHWKGPAYAYVGFDELTEFDEQIYRSMSRLLRDAPLIGEVDGKRVTVPLRKRSASNPGGPGHGWVKSRFIDPLSREAGAVFVPAWIHDNPHMDYEEYLLSLAHLDPVDRARLIQGDWDVTEEGGKFDRHKIEVIDPGEAPPAIKAVRYWDLAGTEPTQTNPDPDFTVGLRLELARDGSFTIADIVRGRWEDSEVQAIVRTTASQDGRSTPVYIEQDPGQAGKAQLNHYKRFVLQGFPCYAGQTKINGRSAAKEVRARAVAAAVGNRLVRIIRGPNLIQALDELAIFPNGTHDDIVDALSGAHTGLTSRGLGQGRTSVPRGRIPQVSRGSTIRR